MVTYGKIIAYDGAKLKLVAPFQDDQLMIKQGIREVEVRLIDGRSISAIQRMKVYALIRDISLYTGHVPDELKMILKYGFLAETGLEYFSLSDVDMTTAREFISYLIDFCLEWNVPCQDSLLNLTDDISRYLYSCLARKKCCLCGIKSELHHLDAVGMGRDRKEILHEGMETIALCNKHHRECHSIGKITFCDKYHVYGIRLDKYLCELLGVNNG